MAITFKQAFTTFSNMLKGVKFTQVKLSNGSLVQYDTPDIITGAPVYLAEGSDDMSILPDGVYTTEAKVKFTITEGLVSEVVSTSEIKPDVNPDKPIVQAMSETKTDTDVITTSEVALEIAEPGAGAPDDLLHPDTDIDADEDFASLVKKHNVLADAYSALQRSHDDHILATQNRFESMSSMVSSMYSELSGKIQTATDDKPLRVTIEKMSAEIERIKNLPSSEEIEEVKGNPHIDPKVKETKAYGVLTAK